MTRNNYRALAERRLETIKRLTKQLQAEKRLNNALSKLAYQPKDKQNPARLKEVKKSTTIRRKLMERSAA